MIELYALKPFFLGVFVTMYLTRNRNKKPKTFEIREI